MKDLRYGQAKKVTLIGAGFNVFLGIIKLLGGFYFHSNALVADGIHSFSDLIIDFMVVFASKYGSLDADSSHPYGHQRIETAATLFLALLLILAGIGIAWDSIHELLYTEIIKPSLLAFPIAVLSIVINEGLFYYTHHLGKRIQSPLVIANAWHHRSDAASSMVVAFGLIGSFFGLYYLDAIAAIIVGIMIIKMGVNYGWDSVKELVDTAVEPEVLQQIETIIQTVDGVKKIHQLRSRSMGGDIYIDVHILVAPFISVSEGHYIAQHVDSALLQRLPQVKDVTVHVDPEDDEVSCPSLHLPNPKRLEQALLLPWKEKYPGLLDWKLHYLDGQIIIDLYCALHFKEWENLSERISEDIKTHRNILKIRLFSEYGVIRG